MLDNQPKRVSAKKRAEQSLFFKIVYFFILLAFVGVTIYILFFSLFLQVGKLNLEGVKELEYEKVYDKSKSFLTGKYLWIFPKDNFLLVFNGKIEKGLMDEFKKIRKVEVEKVFPDTVNIKIEERKSLLLWCSAGPCYIIDEQGYAYQWADFESKEIKENNLIRLVDTGAKPVDVGEKIMDENYIQFAVDIKEKLKREANIEISDEYATSARLAEVVKINTNEGWSIYLSAQISLDQAVRTLKTFLEQEIMEEKRKELEYVDLRVENKIYYKLKKADNPETAGKNNPAENKEEKSDDKKDKE